MPFDRAALEAAVSAHGSVARIVLVQVRGSAPRPAGTSMLVWKGGSQGTIGGGQLELQSMQAAVRMLRSGIPSMITRAALGPALNQCCGGAVTVVTEVFDHRRLTKFQTGFEGLYVRPVERDAGPLPDAFRARLMRAGQAQTPMPVTLNSGWLAESLWQATRQVVIHGAGHVGRALAQVLAPLPQFRVLLCDPRAGFLEGLPAGIGTNPAAWGDALDRADADAAHFIMTPEHDQDLSLCHLLLGRDFAFAGLIGSDTKWARFRKRLSVLGHSPDRIARITCPIGDLGLGKHPQAIALGVATQLLQFTPARIVAKESCT